MALLLTVIFAILFISTFVLMRGSVLRYLLVAISLVGLVGNIALITAGDTHHFGMIAKKQTTIKRIDPAVAIKQVGLNVAIKKSLGNEGESVVVYKNQGAKKTSHTQVDSKTSNKFQKSREKNSQLMTVTNHYQYKNNFFKIMYAGLDLTGDYKSRVNYFELTDDWVVYSPAQLKDLKVSMAKSQKSAGAKLAVAIKQQMTAAMKQNPNMSATQKKELEAKIKSAAADKAKDSIRKQLIKMSLH
ncbi:DUF4811 domain-containing protein [Lentilactobacillus sp. Marseille-Q4993]|uniref:DUF4811 domain-containing protein n=1 Tax=Lentilactobacillus sp. Marseille-Q4993 TaxID=3039492 RepID=UPI0024BD4255|nr:DUF4811 domain-containing protein [Lentilactobacillus sp. Marseille-Q4993]